MRSETIANTTIAIAGGTSAAQPIVALAVIPVRTPSVNTASWAGRMRACMSSNRVRSAPFRHMKEATEEATDTDQYRTSRRAA